MDKENLHPAPRLSSVRKLSGSQPGILDPTQPSRLLRTPGAKLSFAGFDPLTACSLGASDILKPSSNAEMYRPRRVVIETTPFGECTWRFVPSAKRESGVADEGEWPRNVNLCGEPVEMTQDQWDIYKLDPLYECFVPGPYELPTIRAIPPKPRPLSTESLGKRQVSSRSPSPNRVMPPPSAPQRPRSVSVLNACESDSDDEDEVEAMINGRPRRRNSIKERRQELENRRQARREKLKIKNEEVSEQGDEMFTNTYPNGSPFIPHPLPSSMRSTTPELSKRKATGAFDTSWSPDSREVEELRHRLATNYIFSSNSKRTRMSSPPGHSREREFRQKRNERNRTKQQRRMEEAEARRRERDRRLLDEIMEEIPETVPEDTTIDGTPYLCTYAVFISSSDPPLDIPIFDASMAQDDAQDDFYSQTQSGETQDGHFTQPQSADTQDDLFAQTSDGNTQGDSSSNSSKDEDTQEGDIFDLEEEAAHRKAIEESRRKLAELERDRPLWEEQARQRRLREEVEEQARQAKLEEQRREEARKKREVESRARKEREEAEIKKREQEKNTRRERELRDQERRQRRQRWSFGPWTTQRALERYRILSESFDTTKFTSELPLHVEDVPWPSLQSPKIFSVEDVTWDSVERFFEVIRPHLRHQDYKAMVEQSHRRFHPDRWRSRNLLKTVEDEVIKGCMEVAANTVAQALTPIWRSLKDRYKEPGITLDILHVCRIAGASRLTGMT
ncbi:hypothetical protein NP233_g4453 [Leucocoprinus birnbaumii]|uniref:Uncharacterized protein n=1 Tax=Leucocoprinus birnbaumii TaxID=56174 RepID=A0AAD5VW20_9AGAR|nr:hypothetical protein NP233_g4453 [Leucocoprinus birnbaumii]